MFCVLADISNSNWAENKQTVQSESPALQMLLSETSTEVKTVYNFILLNSVVVWNVCRQQSWKQNWKLKCLKDNKYLTISHTHNNLLEKINHILKEWIVCYLAQTIKPQNQTVHHVGYGLDEYLCGNHTEKPQKLLNLTSVSDT